MTDTILIADDDPDIRRFVEVNLRPEGYDVLLAANGEEALEIAIDRQPSLVLLDVMMPKIDGFEVCRRLRADFRTATTPVIMLTARSLSSDKVAGLGAGADDYILKPFDPSELVARVNATLRRTSEMRATSPLTGLPGNVRIDAEIARRLADGDAVAVCYADLDNFKAYNDGYGFQRGDEAIRFAATTIRDAVAAVAPGAFVGHIGGDDFVVVCAPEEAEPVCRRVLAAFGDGVEALYDPADVRAGGIEVRDRRGEIVRHPLLTISIGVSVGRGAGDARGVVDRATEMKSEAKRQTGSVWALDRRSS